MTLLLDCTSLSNYNLKASCPPPPDLLCNPEIVAQTTTALSLSVNHVSYLLIFVECDPSCATCVDFPHMCTSCTNSSDILIDNVCVDQLPKSYYLIKSSHWPIRSRSYQQLITIFNTFLNIIMTDIYVSVTFMESIWEKCEQVGQQPCVYSLEMLSRPGMSTRIVPRRCSMFGLGGGG